MIRKYKKSILILLAGILLAVAMKYADSTEGGMVGSVTRDENKEKTVTFSYSAGGLKDETVTFQVSPRELTDSEGKKLLEEAVKEWNENVLGENESADLVWKDLVFPTEMAEGRVTVDYTISDLTLINSSGVVNTEKLDDQGKLVDVTARFRYKDLENIQKNSFRLSLPEKGSSDRLKIMMNNILAYSNEREKGASELQLPQEIDGYEVTWKDNDSDRWKYFVLMGVAGAVFVEYKKRHDKKEEKKKRDDQLIREYPLMVEQMVLLLGSGMNLFTAWERMASSENDSLYTLEMRQTYREIRQGASEREAYEGFGRRIGINRYRKFAALISYNLTKGNRDLLYLLKTEADEAMEMRKNDAVKLGEEAGTKMLFPMILMFGLLLMVMLFPALVGIGGF